MKVLELIRNKQFLSLAGNMVMALLNLITSAILFRHLSKDQMGCWFFFQTIFILIDTFRTGFLQTAFVKFYAGTDEARSKNVLGSTWYMGGLITGIVLLINIAGIGLTYFTQDLAIITVVKWTSVFFISTLPIVIATWVLQSLQRYMEILYIRVVNQGSFIIAVLALIWFNKLTLDSALAASVLSCILTCILVFACKWSGIRSLPRKSSEAMKEIYHFGKFSVGTSISANLLRYSDTIIIKFALGNDIIAIYNVAQNLMNLLDIPLRSFVTTAMTSISAAQNKGDKEEVQYIFKKYAGALSILFIPAIAALFLLADVGIHLLGGGKYVGTQAAGLFRIFLAVALFLPIDRFIGVTLDVIHKPQINFYKVLIMLSINVTGDLTAIYLMHSIYGVAVASIPTFVIGTLFGYFSLKRYLKFNILDIIKLGWAESIILVKMALGKFAGKIFK